MALRYQHLIFCQPQIRYFDNYSFRKFLNKKLISCLQAVCKMDMAYPLKKKQKFCQHKWLQKIEEAFPQSSIADWKSMKSSILMKFEINIMKIHFQFIYFFKYFQSILWFICSNNSAYMYSLWSRALISASNKICDLKRSRNKLASFFSNNDPTAFVG